MSNMPNFATMSLARKMILGGVAVFFISLFLAWVKVSVDAGILGTISTSMAGGSVWQAWFILISMAAVAVLPFINVKLDPQIEKYLPYGAIGLSALLMLTVVIQTGFSYAGFGLLLALIGLGVFIAGVLQEIKQAPAAPPPPPAA